jgi:CRP/FNR family transcriptional regulator, cyclic AMP receptor protein
MAARRLVGMSIDLGNALGLLGVGFCLASFAVKSMLSLRALALVGNAFFIAYGYVESLLPSILLNAVLLPLNVIRMREISRLSMEITRATLDSPAGQWLLPHMRRRAIKAGEVLFRKGDAADELIYLASGALRMVEVGERVGPGELIGEIGLFSPERKRTQSIVCEADGELYYMTEEMLFRLYYQNPKLGFYLMRLVAERLLRDVQRMNCKPVPA